MPVEHLSPDAGPERAAEILARDGCVVLDGLARGDVLARFRAEMQPWLDALRGNPAGGDAFGTPAEIPESLRRDEVR